MARGLIVCAVQAGMQSRVLTPTPVKKLRLGHSMPVTSVLGADRQEREQEDLLGFLDAS